MTHLQRYFHQVPESERNTGAIAFYASLDEVAKVAPSIAAATLQELRDQSSHLKLIASENFSSLAVQQAMGNLLTDKYAEGIPYHRFYAGCENVDTIEAEAVNELKILFGCDHAYVQPHSGSDANLIAYTAILQKKFGDDREKFVNQKMLGMALDAGGHLTHGFHANISSKLMKASSYTVDAETGYLDYNHVMQRAEEEKPLILIAGYSAYPRKINFAYMKEIADKVGAVLLVDMAHFAGLVAGGVFDGDYNPIPFADIVTSTTHKTLRGPRGGIVLCKEEYKEMVDKGCPHVMGGPLPNVIAAKAVAFKEANAPSFKDYAHNIVKNAQSLAEALKAKGVQILTGGTDNHLALFDIRPFGLNGRQAETLLREAHLTVNRNSIPSDPNGPWYTSGLRIGTPAVTTLGMGPDEMKVIAEVIHDLLSNAKPKEGSKAKATCPQDVLDKAQARVKELLAAHPLYPELSIEAN